MAKPKTQKIKKQKTVIIKKRQTIARKSFRGVFDEVGRIFQSKKLTKKQQRFLQSYGIKNLYSRKMVDKIIADKINQQVTAAAIKKGAGTELWVDWELGEGAHSDFSKERADATPLFLDDFLARFNTLGKHPYSTSTIRLTFGEGGRTYATY